MRTGRFDGRTPNRGAYAIALIGGDGRGEIVEYDEADTPIHRTWCALGAWVRTLAPRCFALPSWLISPQ